MSPRARFSAIIAWSPRQTCRIDSDRTHRFHETPLPDTAPSDPWALYLTDEDGLVRLLAFDFDDHHGTSRARVAADVEHFVTILRSRNLSPLVCASGSGGGRHVWLRCDPVDHDLISQLADDLQLLYPSLDIAPLKNPSTGVVRAPGSPHRAGGHSTIILGARDTDEAHAIRAATVPAPEFLVHELAAEFAELASAVPPKVQSPPSAPRRTQVSVSSRAAGVAPEGARPGIPWPSLPDWAQTLLDSTPDSDASERVFTLARSYVHAGWDRDRFLDAAFKDKAPGLEHLRTRRHGGIRVPRNNARAHAIRQWNRAATTISHPAYLAARPADTTETDAIVHATLVLSDSEVAAFTGVSGLLARRVLTAFCVHLLGRGTVTVPLDVRTWAVKTGLPRQVVARAIRVLEDDGWIHRSQRHRGPLSTVWELVDQRLTHIRDTKEPAPEVVSSLREKITTGLSDLWSLPHLGPLALEVWWALRHAPTIPALARTLGLDQRTILTRLTHAESAGLVRRAGAGRWRPIPLARAEESAGLHAATGTLERRQRAYQAESLRWTQLWAEVAWRSRRPGSAPLPPEVRLLRHHAPHDAPPVRPNPARRQGADLASIAPSCRRQRAASLDQMVTWARSWRHRLARGHALTPTEERIIGTAPAVVPLPASTRAATAA